MVILINGSNLTKGGGLQVAHSFIMEIKNNTQHKFYVVVSKPLSELLDLDGFPSNFDFFVYSIKPNLIQIVTGIDRFLDGIEKKFRPDVVFSIFAPSYWKPRSKHISGFAKPQYIYKDSPFFRRQSKWARFTLKLKEYFQIRNINLCCDELIAETSDVTRRLKDIFPKKKLYTVTNFYHQIYDREELWEKSITLPPFKGFTLLTISANYPHKNLNIIKEVILHLDKNYPSFNFRFVVTIDSRELNIRKKSISKKIVFLGKVAVSQCPNLYRQADFMFLPTLLECFSASYPEAMKMQKPILTSNIAFAKGLCGPAAKYFNPECPSNIAEAIIELVEDKEEQMRLVELGKRRLKIYDNSKDRADKYLKIIES